IENGIISQISKQIPNSSKVREIKLDNLHVSQGWFDSSVSFGEPGFEERETLLNGLETAAYSGFTDVAVNSNTNPVIDNYTNIAFLKAKSHDHSVQLHPIGALTKNADGEDLAELYDMKNAGAVAYYDYQKPVKNPN